MVRGGGAPAGDGRPTVCVLVGSPRPQGACAALADELARGIGRGGCRADVALLADYGIAGCTGCGACERTGACVLDARDGARALRERLATADGLALVAPVYFAGTPSQLKAFLDRLQPFWAQRYVLGTRPVLPHAERRPLDIVAVGSGGDPFGYEPLVTCARSALRMADFELARVRCAVGYRAPHRPDAAARPSDEAFEQRARAWGEDLGARVHAREAEHAARCADGTPMPGPASVAPPCAYGGPDGPTGNDSTPSDPRSED